MLVINHSNGSLKLNEIKINTYCVKPCETNLEYQGNTCLLQFSIYCIVDFLILQLTVSWMNKWTSAPRSLNFLNFIR